MANEALQRSLAIEKALRERDDVQDAEVTLVQTATHEKHIANVRLKPEAEMIELSIDSVPLPIPSDS